MKLVRWKRFTWDLSKIPELASVPLPAQYYIRGATRADWKDAKEVIFSAFSLDMAWSDTFKTFREFLSTEIDFAFGPSGMAPLVVTHGQRIIAASSSRPEPSADSNLSSGPCVRVEYRNRGLGSALLLHTLWQLQQAGLAQASGICKETAPASKFLYTKFGSTAVAADFEPTGAAT